MAWFACMKLCRALTWLQTMALHALQILCRGTCVHGNMAQIRRTELICFQILKLTNNSCIDLVFQTESVPNVKLLQLSNKNKT